MRFPHPRLLLCGLLLSVAASASADEIRIAVAANFAAPAQKLAAEFEKQSGHRLVMSVGATGNFFAQIRHGAPFEVLLAADDETPARLERDGYAVPGSRFTYAQGRLVLWSMKMDLVDGEGEVLRRPSKDRIAIANPEQAPYGRAAMETLESLKLASTLRPRLVFGESIAQAHQFVATGNATMGFVALSQVFENGKLKAGSAWVVPARLHAPIRQDAVLLVKGRGRPAAEAFLQYLKSEPARQLIRQAGYEL